VTLAAGRETGDASGAGGDIAVPEGEPGEEAVRIRSNPLDPNRIESIPREEIESLDESSLSPMPSGLLSTLQPSEVQDLIRYVLHSP